MVIGNRAGKIFVDLHKESQEKFSGVIFLYIENGKIINAKKNVDTDPIIIK